MIRKVHRKCMMRGCHNTTAYHISLSREIGNSIIICRDCAKKAVEMIDALENKNAPAAASVENKTTAEPAASVENKTAAEPCVEKYICTECGREFKSDKGLAVHMRIHKE